MGITVSTSPQNITASVGETQIDVTVSGGIGPSGTAGASSWNDITGKPATFSPSAHTHDYVEVAGGSTFANFLTTAGTLGGALSEIDSELSARALAADFNQGLKTTDSPTFAGATISGNNVLFFGGGNGTDSIGIDSLDVYFFKNGGGLAGSLVNVSGSLVITFGDGSTQSTAGAALSHAHSASDVTSGTFDVARLPVGTGSTQVAAGNHTHSQLHDRSHAITSTSDHTAGNWKVFHSNGSGELVELAVGASGTVLKANGTSSAPTFSAIAASQLPVVLEQTEAVGNSGSTKTLSLTTGSVQTVTLSASCTFTMPTATAGASITLILTQGSNYTATFTGVKWAGGTAPTITATTNAIDVLVFVSDGTNWYGVASQKFS